MKQLRLILSIICVWLFFQACTQDDGSKEENMDLIRAYVKAVEEKDVETMATLLHENYMGYGPSVNDSINKTGALENWKYLAEEYYEHINYDDWQMIAVSIDEGPRKGHWVSNWSLLTLSFKDGSGPVQVYFNAVYRIEDGQIIHSRTFYNEADVLRQLGHI